ncbi:MAG: GGDEF domain-containing protein [Deltaproteobacteria bacterium]|nr:GGDEF domain-containing protein [Deltaproteobacteria bacterium]
MDFEDKTSVLNRDALSAGENKPARSACFIVIAGGQAGKMYKLDDNELVIGRVNDASILIEDDGVSRRHAKICRQPDGALVITDLGSTNGTFVNGERVTTRVLKDGDKIQIGTTTILKFSLQDTLEEDFLRRQYESATRDALTQCFNKKYLLERLPSELAFAKRHDKALALAMIDVDHFKQVNDTHGHQAGDVVLRGVAKVMRDAIRSDDLLARYGGEEFALVMRETLPASALAAMERLRRQIEASTFDSEGTPLKVTVSIGIASWTEDRPETPEAMIGAADAYLYQAKRSGRNRTQSHGSR